MILALLVILMIVGVAIGIVWAGRVIRRHTTRRWPFAVGSGVLFGLALATLIVPSRIGGGSRFALVLFVLMIIAALVCLATLFSDGAEPSAAHSWAAAHGVTVTPRNSDFIVAYVFEGHRLRLVCGIGGFIAAAALSAGTGIDLKASGWVWLLSGYLVGVVWSEGWLTRLPAGTNRIASLTPRRVSDYLSKSMIVAQVATALAAVVLAGFALARGSDPHLVGGFGSEFGEASARSLQQMAIGMAVASALLIAGVGLLQRRIVGKAQPVAEPDLLAADDAVRASAVHLLSGTAIAIVLLLVGTQLTILAALGAFADAVAAIGFLICFVGALVAWRVFGRRSWVVRRMQSEPRLQTSLNGSLS